MLMRVSVGIHLDDLGRFRDYDLMSKNFTHTQHLHYLMQDTKPQMSSCFLWLCKMIVLTGYTIR
jgi:hypothetical protein